MFRFLLGFICGLLAFNWIQAHTPASLLDYFHSLTNAIGANTKMIEWPVSQKTNSGTGSGSWVHIEAVDNSAKPAMPRVNAMLNNVALPIIKPLVSRLPLVTSDVKLCGTIQSYKSALTSVHVSRADVALISRETGGIAYGNTAIIPLYQQKTDGDLANSLTHELTHVLFNEIGIGNAIPTWINEGLAWTNGIEAQRQVDPNAATQLEQNVRYTISMRAARKGLLPLGADENAILHANYNIEGEDYLAVQLLIQERGAPALSSFLNDLKSMDATTAFQKIYHESIADFNQTFQQQMTTNQ